MNPMSDEEVNNWIGQQTFDVFDQADTLSQNGPKLKDASKLNSFFSKNYLKLGAGIGVGVLAISSIVSGLKRTTINNPNNSLAGENPSSINNTLPYKRIEGFDDSSYASTYRSQNTDFGSPWQGILDSTSLSIINSLSNNSTPTFAQQKIPIEQKIADFKQFNMQTPLQQQLIEAKLNKQNIQSMNRLQFLDPAITTPLASNDYFKYGLNRKKKLQEIDISSSNYVVDDADTINVKTLFGETSVRLSGIDAPETGHGWKKDELKLREEQPYGKEAKEYLQNRLKSAKSIKLIVDPQQDTYGRSLGVLVADGENINLDLIKSGHALSLPFGNPEDDLVSRGLVSKFENVAYNSKEGLWKNNYWRIYKQTMGDKVRQTNNSLIRIDRLAKNVNLAGLEASMTYAEEEDIDGYIKNVTASLRPKLQSTWKKKYEEKPKISLNYGFSQNHVLDKLRLETNEFMSYNKIKNKDFSSEVNRVNLNKAMVLDSMYQSTSSYRGASAALISNYEDKSRKKSKTGRAQRMVNKNMNSPTQNAGTW